MSDDGVVAEKRNRGRVPKPNDVNDKDSKETKKRGRPAGKLPAKADKKIEKEGENGEPAAKRGRGRPKKSQKKAKAPSSGRGRGRPPAKKVEKEESAEENDEEEEEEVEDED
ncbi:hypothetical protein QTP88_014962 [Uroleucon formosanum]